MKNLRVLPVTFAAGLVLAAIVGAPEISGSVLHSTSAHKAVYGALRAHLIGMHVKEEFLPSAGELEFMGHPPTNSLDFVVAGFYRDNLRNALYVRMRCEPRVACVPFLVGLHASDAKSNVLRSAIAKNANPFNKEEKRRTIIRQANRCQQNDLLVRAGRSASLIVRTNGMRLIVPALVLDCGSSGQHVRARVKKTNKFFEAQVTGENLVTAIF